MLGRPRRLLRFRLLAAAAIIAGVGSQVSAREEFDTDRDSFTFAPTTPGPVTSILESSYSFIDDRSGPQAHSFPEVLIRRGLGERLEARIGFNYETGGPGTVSGSEFGGEDLETEDESRILYGAKLETSGQDGWLPRSAAVLQGYTPVSGPSGQSTIMVGEAFGWAWGDRWEWTTAMRYGTGFADAAAFDQWAPSSVLKLNLADRWNVHAEYFAISSSGKRVPINLQCASLGGHVLVDDNLEIGLRLGWGLNQSSPSVFANFGAGWRH